MAMVCSDFPVLRKGASQAAYSGMQLHVLHQQLCSCLRPLHSCTLPTFCAMCTAARLRYTASLLTSTSAWSARLRPCANRQGRWEEDGAQKARQLLGTWWPGGPPGLQPNSSNLPSCLPRIV